MTSSPTINNCIGNFQSEVRRGILCYKEYYAPVLLEYRHTHTRTHTHIYILIYIYTYIYVYTYIYIYMYMYMYILCGTYIHTPTRMCKCIYLTCCLPWVCKQWNKLHAALAHCFVHTFQHEIREPHNIIHGFNVAMI